MDHSKKSGGWMDDWLDDISSVWKDAGKYAGALSRLVGALPGEDAEEWRRCADFLMNIERARPDIEAMQAFMSILDAAIDTPEIKASSSVSSMVVRLRGLFLEAAFHEFSNLNRVMAPIVDEAKRIQQLKQPQKVMMDEMKPGNLFKIDFSNMKAPGNQ